MSLREFETVLARLTTEGGFRTEFFADRDTALSHYELSSAERDSLQRVDRVQIEQFARSLHAKRRAEAAPLMPWAVAALGEKFSVLFAAHCEAYRPTGLLKPSDDARAFCLRCAIEPDLDATTRHLLCWEAQRRTPPGGWPTLRLYRVCPLIRTNLSGGTDYTVAAGITMLWNWHGRWHGRMLQWPGSRFLLRSRQTQPL